MALAADIIDEILNMKSIGLAAAKPILLPDLYKRVYKRQLPNCNSCAKEAFDTLIIAAETQIGGTKQIVMLTHRFKRDCENNTIVIYQNGQKALITKNNLTQDKLNIVLQIGKYAHNFEQNPDYVADKPENQAEIKKVIEDSKKNGGITIVDASASTSDNQESDGKQFKKNKKKQD